MKTFTRISKETGQKCTLTFEQAVGRFIIDNVNYGSPEDMNAEEWLEDMSTVFEAQSMLKESDELDAGYYLYVAN